MSYESATLQRPETIFNVSVEAMAQVATAAGGIAAGFSPKAQEVVNATDPGDTVRLLAEGFPLIADARYGRAVDPDAAQAYLDKVRTAGASLRAGVEGAMPTVLGPLDKVLEAISADDVTAYTFADRVREALDAPATKEAARGLLGYFDTIEHFPSPSGQLRKEVGHLRVSIAGDPDKSIGAKKVAGNTRAVAEDLLSGRTESASQTPMLGAIATRVVAGIDHDKISVAKTKLGSVSDSEISAAAPLVVSEIDKALGNDRTRVRRSITGLMAGAASKVHMPKIGEMVDRKLDAVAHIGPLLDGLFEMLPETQRELAETRAQIESFFLTPQS
jgi:hypothetical protein